MALALMLIMFSVALGLRAKDFIFVFERPLQFGGGVVVQIIGLPLLTLALIVVLAPPPSVALGMLVVACCPGGASSNLLTYLARGNVAYSVSLTATSSVLAAVLTPVSILFWSQAYEPTAELLQTIGFSALGFLIQTTVLLALPLAAGMLLAARSPALADRIRSKVVIAGSVALGSVIVYGIIHFFDILFPALPQLGAITVLHNSAAFLTGFVAALLLRTESSIRRALTFEIGIQNSGLAIVILLSQLDGLGGAAAIAAFWGVWHLIAGGFMVMVFRTVDRKGGR